MNTIVNEKSVKRAKVILEKIGYITLRIKERDEARKKLEFQLNSLKTEINNKKFDKLKLIMENAFKKEANLIKSNFYESEKVKELREVIRKLSSEHEKALNSLKYMKLNAKEYQKLQKLQEKRENILEKKINFKTNQKIVEKLIMLEKKYELAKKSGNYPSPVLNNLKDRINKVKKSLS